MNTKNTDHTKPRILGVRIVREVDTDPDTSYLGKYTDTAEENAIVRATGEFVRDIRRREAIIDKARFLADQADWNDDTKRRNYFEDKAGRLENKWTDVNEIPDRGREYRFFVPYGAGEEPGTKAWRTCAKQDFDRMERLCTGEWCYLYIRAEADVCFAGSDVVQTMTSGGLGGVESDSDDLYLAGVESEEKDALRDILASAGFPQEDFAEAFENVEAVNK